MKKLLVKVQDVDKISHILTENTGSWEVYNMMPKNSVNVI